jgi:CheY-like chemotaxis protein
MWGRRSRRLPSANNMKTILIAEDRDASRELLSVVLTAAGYHVIQAADGEEALTRAAETLADLVILDIHMPRLDGFGVIRRLRDDPAYATVPVIALTASAMAGDRDSVLAAGFSEYISKPVNMSLLRREIARLLENRS